MTKNVVPVETKQLPDHLRLTVGVSHVNTVNPRYFVHAIQLVTLRFVDKVRLMMILIPANL
jgi:hypothetical protein